MEDKELKLIEAIAWVLHASFEAGICPKKAFKGLASAYGAEICEAAADRALELHPTHSRLTRQ